MFDSTYSALQVLIDPETVPSVVYVAAQIYFASLMDEGETLADVEPEAMKLHVRKEHGNDDKIPEQNWEKLRATLALRNDGRCMYDGIVFGNTMLALNGEVIIPDALNQASPAEIAWGLEEATLLTKDITPDGSFEDYLDYEPVRYTAVSMQHDGFLLAPDELSFAEEDLIHLICKTHEPTQSKLKKAWTAVRGQITEESLTELSEEDELQNQILQLATVKLYVEKMRRLRRAQIAKLNGEDGLA